MIFYAVLVIYVITALLTISYSYNSSSDHIIYTHIFPDISECGQDIASFLIKAIAPGKLIVPFYITLKYAKAQAERSAAKVGA